MAELIDREALINKIKAECDMQDLIKTTAIWDFMWDGL